MLTPGWFFLGADLTEIQCDVSDVSRRYQALGTALQERQQQLSAMLDRMQEVQQDASSMLKWLESKERALSELEASSSPTKTETMRAQAEHNKVNFLKALKDRPVPPLCHASSKDLLYCTELSTRVYPELKKGIPRSGIPGRSMEQQPKVPLRF